MSTIREPEEPSAPEMARMYLTQALAVLDEPGTSRRAITGLVKHLMQRTQECLDVAAAEEDDEPQYVVGTTTTTTYSDSDGNEIGPELIPLVDAAFDLYPQLVPTCSRAQIGVALDKTLRALLKENDNA